MDSLLSMEEEEEKSATIVAVEKILSYSFKDKALLVEALTHPAYYNNKNKNNNKGESFRSYQRLEFVGDVVLGLAVSKYLYLEHHSLGPGQLTDLRSANVGNDKLARVAVRLGLHRYIRHNNNLDATLLDEVQEFADEVSQEGDIVLHGSIKAPKVLADIVESLAAAIYFDLNFDLQKLWMIFRDLLKPIVTLEVLQQQPHPIDTLYKQCAKQGREVAIKPWRDGAKNIASVYVDGVFVASGSSSQLMDIARLNAAKQALLELAKSMPTNIGRLDFSFGLNKSLKIEGAMQKLREFCQKKRWAVPSYSIVKAEGPPHAKKYVYLVQIENADGGLSMEGEEKSKVKEAKNSAASCIIRAFLESNPT
ncbi:ribonuclease 3-like protein 2 isoform X1 [Quercus suber]|uniref:ribonuclease 3-like protein 2 isoform X1 n=1 Tax=Quercus suber TaxID=58331 RepID=UPI000CE267A2|nr:ribonuclease 3-like protein 2 isoform X1 [Quercus suber]POF21372.1 ribonuclease 3-like protein 2 [Quercus suber]